MYVLTIADQFLLGRMLAPGWHNPMLDISSPDQPLNGAHDQLTLPHNACSDIITGQKNGLQN
jgi:hypothetical protein